jgi:translation initiation factor 1 (eIF-1/SUI1)
MVFHDGPAKVEYFRTGTKNSRFSKQVTWIQGSSEARRSIGEAIFRVLETGCGSGVSVKRHVLPNYSEHFRSGS